MKKYVTVLNVLSCLSVVLLHSNDGAFWTFGADRAWITADIIESICYFAVPVFFMISGVTLIDYRERYSTIEYIKKRVTKTVIPFFAWSFIATAYQIFVKKITVEGNGIRYIANGIFNTKFVSIYWFFIPLFSLYLLIPVLDYIPANKRKRVFEIIIVTGFIFNSFLPFVFNILGGEYNSSLSYSLSGGYSFYLFLGYFIDNYKIKKNHRYLIYASGVLGLIMHIVGTMKLSYAVGEIVETYKGYLNVPCICYTAAIFLFFKVLDEKNVLNKVYSFVKPLGSLTFGIYLIHWYFLDIIACNTSIDTRSLIYRIGGGVLVFLISAACTKILKMFPGVKCIIP